MFPKIVVLLIFIVASSKAIYGQMGAGQMGAVQMGGGPMEPGQMGEGQIGPANSPNSGQTAGECLIYLYQHYFPHLTVYLLFLKPQLM